MARIGIASAAEGGQEFSENVLHDTLQRISYLLGIHKALQILYSDPALADSWIRRPNAAFGGQSALERMLAGDVSDLAAVRAHLDAARGGWT